MKHALLGEGRCYCSHGEGRSIGSCLPLTTNWILQCWLQNFFTQKTKVHRGVQQYNSTEYRVAEQAVTGMRRNLYSTVVPIVAYWRIMKLGGVLYTLENVPQRAYHNKVRRDHDYESAHLQQLEQQVILHPQVCRLLPPQLAAAEGATGKNADKQKRE